MKQNRVAGGTYLNYERHDLFGCCLSAIEGHQVDDLNCQQIPRKKNIEEKVDYLNCQQIPRKKTVKKLFIFFIVLKTV
jgi:hypothetical protein